MPDNSLTPDIALQRVQSPPKVPSKPIDAARSFRIQPDGTVLDNQQAPLVPVLNTPAKRSPWQRHSLALAGAALGTIAGAKLYHTLGPLNLKRLHWTAKTRWPEANNLVNTVTQPVLKGIRENAWLNNTLTWAKATMAMTPVLTGAMWGEQIQQRRRKASQIQAINPGNTVA
jgi:hypothetical protein